MIRESFEVTAATVKEATARALQLLGRRADESGVRVEVLVEGTAIQSFAALREPARVRASYREEGFGFVSRELPEAVPAPPPPERETARRSLVLGNISATRAVRSKPDLVIEEAPEAPTVAQLNLEPSKARVREEYTPSEEDNRVVEEIAEELMEAMGVPYEVRFEHASYQRVYFDVEEDDAGSLIGRRGSGVDALELVLSRMIAQRCGSTIPVQVDLNGYRERERERLEAHALELVDKVLREGVDLHLEPMNPRERRIVHLAVQAHGGVKSYTLGEGPRRHVVLARDPEAAD